MTISPNLPLFEDGKPLLEADLYRLADFSVDLVRQLGIASHWGLFRPSGADGLPIPHCNVATVVQNRLQIENLALLCRDGHVVWEQVAGPLEITGRRLFLDTGLKSGRNLAGKTRFGLHWDPNDVRAAHMTPILDIVNSQPVWQAASATADSCEQLLTAAAGLRPQLLKIAGLIDDIGRDGAHDSSLQWQLDRLAAVCGQHIPMPTFLLEMRGAIGALRRAVRRAAPDDRVSELLPTEIEITDADCAGRITHRIEDAMKNLAKALAEGGALWWWLAGHMETILMPRLTKAFGDLRMSYVYSFDSPVDGLELRTSENSDVSWRAPGARDSQPIQPAEFSGGSGRFRLRFPSIQSGELTISAPKHTTVQLVRY
jgi:hypothetical protein